MTDGGRVHTFILAECNHERQRQKAKAKRMLRASFSVSLSFSLTFFYTVLPLTYGMGWDRMRWIGWLFIHVHLELNNTSRVVARVSTTLSAGKEVDVDQHEARNTRPCPCHDSPPDQTLESQGFLTFVVCSLHPTLAPGGCCLR